jgi:hypothetical protein
MRTCTTDIATGAPIAATAEPPSARDVRGSRISTATNDQGFIVVHLDPLDRSPYLKLSPSFHTCTAEKGFRSVRANVPVRTGAWYTEEGEVVGQSGKSVNSVFVAVAGGGGGGSRAPNGACNAGTLRYGWEYPWSDPED